MPRSGTRPRAAPPGWPDHRLAGVGRAMSSTTMTALRLPRARPRSARYDGRREGASDPSAPMSGASRGGWTPPGIAGKSSVNGSSPCHAASAALPACPSPALITALRFALYSIALCFIATSSSLQRILHLFSVSVMSPPCAPEKPWWPSAIFRSCGSRPPLEAGADEPVASSRRSGGLLIVLDLLRDPNKIRSGAEPWTRAGTL